VRFVWASRPTVITTATALFSRSRALIRGRRSWVRVTPSSQWGDPYTNFVGNVNGSDTTPTGYGVYWPVILSIARSHGVPNATGGEGYAPGTIYNALTAGHPVEVWVETNWMRPRLGTWTAWDGRKVRYSFVEHAVILSGVSASQVRINDPLHGTQYWVSKSQFEASWRDFNDMAVIFQ